MSPHIHQEVMLLLMSVYGGVILVLCYDVLRILRRLFPAGVIRVIVEDIIFWTISAIFVFHILLKYNDGMPRYYSVAGVLGVMWLFEILIGRRAVDWVALWMKKSMNTLLKPLKKAAKMFKLKIRKIQVKLFIKKPNENHKR